MRYIPYGSVIALTLVGAGACAKPADKPASAGDLPMEEVGEIIVLATRPDTCVGLIRKSRLEIDVGDKLEMREGE